MLRHAKGLVSALLPVVPFVLCPACGGGGSDNAPVAAIDGGSPAAPVSSPVNNAAPTISGTVEAMAHVGITYSYLPLARDADGDELVFSAQNLPPWASIDPTNGHISGTPGENDVGIYESITITVADALRSAVTTPFSITVVPETASGYAALQWEIPAAKVDGSPLDDLAGYRIMYGRDAQDLDQSVFINDPAVTSFEFTTLQSGIWYFSVVAVNAGGLEGPPTTPAMKSI
jgi:hypothetical protein